MAYSNGIRRKVYYGGHFYKEVGRVRKIIKDSKVPGD